MSTPLLLLTVFVSVTFAMALAALIVASINAHKLRNA